MFDSNEYLEMFRPLVAALEQLAEDEMSDRMAATSAKMAKKFMVAYGNEGFSDEQSLELTKVAMQQTGFKQS